jgi:hypothetical protein
MRPNGRVLSVVLCAVTSIVFNIPSAISSDAHSPNIEQLAEVSLSWPEELQPDGFAEMAFKDDLVIAAARSNGPDNQSNGVNGGAAIFRRLDHRPYLRQLSVLPCQATGEISVVGNVLIAGGLRDHSRPSEGCNRNGLQIIDISDPRQPRVAKWIELGCGVDVHTVLKKQGRWYVIAPATCNEDVETPANVGVYSEMAIVRIFPDRPAKAEEVGNPENDSVGCAEVFVLSSRDLMVCLFFETFMLFDVSDPVNPKPLTGPMGIPNQAMPDGVQYIFSRGAFTWDGQYMVLGGGPMGIDGRCPAGEDVSLFFFNVEDSSNPVLVGDWTTPHRSGDQCFSNGFNVLPMKRTDRYVLAAGFRTQGVSVVDFSDPTRATEIGFYVPTFTPRDVANPANPDPYLTARIWAAYWHNGRIYATAEGEDAPRLRAFRVDGLGSRAVRYFRGSYSPQFQLERFR